ncbi:alpha/beta hydrolase [Rhizobacter sp. J219]|jgi:pimeloyl-ACP methyl ester carboxylesterase|uniref:esterase/lipase family protein n=1 Tax=Rhizobacter sp. J219 TaxID=2898430 RepID=UPI00215147CB|nr:alpha/beta hydrolase [Rhizobacter sp. J219]MCR5882511.1 alpha/beta hydrolase [Rhizobacter sp. J219]
MNKMMAAPHAVAPSLALLGVEPFRAVIEYAGMHLMNREVLPEGDGHPVIIFPGLAADKRSLVPLRNCCEALGYAVYDWEQGFNTGPKGDIDEWLNNLATHVRGVATLHNRKVSLVGWSLGGIYAREIAKLQQPLVRRVITLGTPLLSHGDETNVGWLYRLVSGKPPFVDDQLAARLRAAPPVPTTSIYSRTDGVVAWESCLLDGDCDGGENVEVEGSHMGLPWNPQVLAIVAERLARSEALAAG